MLNLQGRPLQNTRHWHLHTFAGVDKHGDKQRFPVQLVSCCLLPHLWYGGYSQRTSRWSQRQHFQTTVHNNTAKQHAHQVRIFCRHNFQRIGFWYIVLHRASTKQRNNQTCMNVLETQGVTLVSPVFCKTGIIVWNIIVFEHTTTFGQQDADTIKLTNLPWTQRKTANSYPPLFCRVDHKPE